MSRSYKFPIWKESSKFSKKMSNKKNRQWLKTQDRGFKSSAMFKRLVNPYDICDYWSFPISKEDIKRAKRK